MGIFTDDNYIIGHDEHCPCCKCDTHWMACRFCEYYETTVRKMHEEQHTK